MDTKFSPPEGATNRPSWLLAVSAVQALPPPPHCMYVHTGKPQRSPEAKYRATVVTMSTKNKSKKATNSSYVCECQSFFPPFSLPFLVGGKIKEGTVPNLSVQPPPTPTGSQFFFFFFKVSLWVNNSRSLSCSCFKRLVAPANPREWCSGLPFPDDHSLANLHVVAQLACRLTELPTTKWEIMREREREREEGPTENSQHSREGRG